MSGTKHLSGISNRNANRICTNWLIHVMDNHFLDATGLQCPLPLLKMKLALNKMVAGERLRVTTTDKASVRDFRSYCELSGNNLLMAEEGLTDNQQVAYFFTIEKGN